MDPKVTDKIPLIPPPLKEWIEELRTLSDARLSVRRKLVWSALLEHSWGWSQHWAAVEKEVRERNLSL
jgi:hypothetical protein